MKSASRSFERVSVFGLGKLGAIVVGCYASRGFEVIGVDVVPELVRRCNSGLPPVQEPGIEDLYRSSNKRFSATLNGTAAVLASDVTLIAVPTPSLEDGGYSLRYVLEASKVIGEALREKIGYHLVVLKSTVLPGSCSSHILPLLEERSAKRCGLDFGFCYNPEFIALGSVIYNIFNPDLNLIGESDLQAGENLVAIYSRLLTDKFPTARMNLVNAELAKLAVNSYVTMKISFANLLAGLCEQLPGANVDIVTAALGLDSRIGAKYLKGGLGFGGPCFPRDNAAMLSLARQLSTTFPLAEATDLANRDVPGRVVDFVTARAPAHGRVSILGLSYKPDTHVIEESQSLQIAKLLAERAFEVSVYDPMAMDLARPHLGSGIRCTESAQACIDGADVVVIATPWNEFKTLNYSSDDHSGKPIVIDCWGLLDQNAHRSVAITRLGANSISRKLPMAHQLKR
jgi:UDPglucose 6-dehydrogenase